ncbi:MAG: hypothetical protein RMJ88_08800 [Thermogemmata sp.]|nr:hypothetical protein [Thermogemmata sp.]
MATKEWLRHQGYIEEEVAQIVGLLQARKVITVDRRHGVLLLSDHVANERQSRKRVIMAHKLLVRLHVPFHLPDPLPEHASELTRLADYLEELVQEKIKSCRALCEDHLNRIRTAIGCLRAISLPTEWLNTGLKKHLAGMAGKLRRIQVKLVDVLRQEAANIETELAASDADRFGWAVRWVRRDNSIRARIEKLLGRVAEFEARSLALLSWMPVNQELSALTTLTLKIALTDPAPAYELNQLIARMREHFSTRSWEPLGSARKFRRELQTISRVLQGLLYSQLQVYLKEVELLRQRFGPLLPNTPAPTLEAVRKRSKAVHTHSNPFAALYDWALSGFQAAFTRAKRLKAQGQPWMDPCNKRRSWNELASTVENMLVSRATGKGLEHVLKVGEKLTELLRGFTGRGVGVFDSPEAPPDFDTLREQFLRGEVVIRVEPKKR